MTEYSGLSMPIGEAIFIQRSVRTFKPDPIPKEKSVADRRGAARAGDGLSRDVRKISG
jgi:hypothetical protein